MRDITNEDLKITVSDIKLESAVSFLQNLIFHAFP